MVEPLRDQRPTTALDGVRLQFDMRDGTRREVPAEVVALHRARALVAEGLHPDAASALRDVVVPEFRADPYAVLHWAMSAMTWADVAAHAIVVKGPNGNDMQGAWNAASKRIVRQAPASEAEPSFESLAAGSRALTRRRKQTPSEILLRESREDRGDGPRSP